MNKRSSGCPGRKKRIVGWCKTIPHIREVHLGAIRQDVTSAIRMLSGWCLASSTKGGNTVKIVPNSLFWLLEFLLQEGKKPMNIIDDLRMARRHQLNDEMKAYVP